MSYGSKECLYCGQLIEIKLIRDIERKKYCSQACRQRARYANGEMPWFDRGRQLCCTPEANMKRSKSLTGRPKPVIMCPHCNKSGGASQMKQWHFDNCKEKK